MSHHLLFVLCYIAWFLARVWGLKRRITLPALRGEGWFFDVPPAADGHAASRLRREYERTLVTASLVVEVLALADALYFARLSHLVLVQLPLFLVLTAIHHLVVRRAIGRARLLVAPAPEPVAYSLKVRRLRDYTHPPFEVLVGSVTLGWLAIALPDPDLLRVVLVAAYIHVGLLLLKGALVRRPVVLPTDHTDEYVRLVGDATRAGLRIIDTQRAFMTFLLAVAASTRFLPASLERWRPQIGLAFLTTSLAIAVAVSLAAARRSRGIADRLKALGGPIALHRGLRDPENLRLGGFVYWNADNPAVVVSGGPLLFAVNLLNKRTYAYAAYALGFVVLMVRFADVFGDEHWTHGKGRPGLRAMVPVLVVADVSRSVDFYRGRLGFVADSVYGEPPYFAILSRGGFDLMLSRAEEPVHVRPPDGNWDVYVRVSDVAAEAAAIRAGGLALAKDPHDTDYQMREIEVLDPDGHRICLAQPVL